MIKFICASERGYSAAGFEHPEGVADDNADRRGDRNGQHGADKSRHFGADHKGEDADDGVQSGGLLHDFGDQDVVFRLLHDQRVSPSDYMKRGRC